MASASENSNHSLTMENRNRLFITGACELEGFEEKNMTIKTTMGLLYLKGEFNGVEYSEDGGKGGFFARLFG